MILQLLEYYTKSMTRVNRTGGPTRHQVAAEATRRVIVEAAAALFLTDGYVRTTVEEVAARAGVAVQTVYNSVGPKRELLSRVLDLSASGPESPTPVPQFMRARTAKATTAQEVIGVIADWFVEANARIAGVHAIIRQAAAVDPEVAALERERAAQRLRNYHEAAREIAAREGAALGVPIDEAAALIWSLGHPEVYRGLVLEGDWPIERYRMWVQSALSARLVDF